MRYKLFLLISLLLFIESFKSLSAQPSLFSFEKYVSNKGDTLQYRMLFPDYDTLRKYPLVIFLHGSGERGNDNDVQLKWGVKNFATDENMSMYPALVIAPQCPANQDWAAFRGNMNTANNKFNPNPTRSMELLRELIADAVKKLPVDTNRIYITGLSMGGFGTFEALERYPNLFAAAVPVCGGGDTLKASLIKHIPIWIFHGSEDPVVSPAFSINMATALFKAGAFPGLTIYPETGHFSWIQAYSDKLMMQWLFRQHK